MKIKVGDKIVFKGYSEPPEEGQTLLEEGEEYTVHEVNSDDNSVMVRIDNPDFNPKKKVSDTNPETMELEVFEEEFTLPAAKGKPAAKATPAKGRKPVAEVEEDEAEADEEEAPAPKKAAKAAPKKTAAKAAKKVAAKPAKKAKAETEEAEAESADPYADLSEDDEDQEIVELVNASDDVLALAKEVSEEASAIEYKLGGVLFHVRKSGAYTELDKRYSEKGGFGLYVLEQLNVEYRKAMYLIDIYYKWNKFGLDAEKVAQIGWAKAAKIAAVMTEDTAAELLELAENNTVADLVENIKTSYKEVGGTKGEKKVLKTFKFRLFEDQAAAVEEVLQAVASAMEFKNLDQAFEHIVMEWAAEHPIAPEKPAKTKAKAAPTKDKARAAA